MAEIRWYGHNCFRIKSRDAVVLTDPLNRDTGYSFGTKPSADIVTVSHNHPGHSNLRAIKDGYALIDGPGEYEIHEVFVYGFRSYHDTNQGADLGYNTIYVLELEGMRIAHIGDLGHDFTQVLTDGLDNIDVLLIPAGGGEGIISPETAARIVGRIEPNVVIPMQFAIGNGDRQREPITTFAQKLGLDPPEPVNSVTIKHSDFADAMSFVVLNPNA